MLESKIGSAKSSEIKKPRGAKVIRNWRTGKPLSIVPIMSVICSFAELHKDCSRAAVSIDKVRAMLSWRIERVPG